LKGFKFEKKGGYFWGKEEKEELEEKNQPAIDRRGGR